MHKTERPNIFLNSFTHYRAEQMKKGVICEDMSKLNTEESVFKDEQFNLHKCLGHSNVVFILKVSYKLTCIYPNI